MPRARQAGPREPARAGTPIDAGAGGELLDRQHGTGRAEHVLEHPAHLARQRCERRRELPEHLVRGGVHLFVFDHFAQPFGMVVEPCEHDVADAALAETEQHRRDLRRERRVENQRQGREQHAKPFDRLSPRLSRQQRIDDGDLDGPAADRIEHAIPRTGVCDRKAPRDRAAQLVILNVRYCRQYEHAPPSGPLSAAKTPYDAAKTP